MYLREEEVEKSLRIMNKATEMKLFVYILMGVLKPVMLIQ